VLSAFVPENSAIRNQFCKLRKSDLSIEVTAQYHSPQFQFQAYPETTPPLLAIINSPKIPPILGVQDTLIILEHIEVPEVIMARSDNRKVWLGLRISVDVPGEDIATAECN
jgi:hypothetical protein